MIRLTDWRRAERRGTGRTNRYFDTSEWPFMIAEMIYTSAPNTLDGAGYGVVGKTAGMPDRLEKFLRNLNRYDFMGTADAGAGPIVFSHTMLHDGSSRWHVLSRVGPGGLDYSHREVFLAHHVALTSDELGGAAPLGLMQSPGLFTPQWDGRVGALPRRALPAAPRRQRGTGGWGALAGDRNWAQVWAGGWAQHEGQPSFLVVPPAADVLALFEEAAAHLAPPQAERVTFITHMVADRAGIAFEWIGLPAASELARSALRRFPDRALDLSRPLGSVPHSLLERVTAPPAAAPPAAAPVRDAPPVPQRAAASPAVEDFGDIWQEEARQATRKRPKRTRRADPALPPPPPIPMRRVTTTQVCIAAGVVCALVVTAAALNLRRSRKGEGPPAEIAQDGPNAPRGDGRAAGPDGDGGSSPHPQREPNAPPAPRAPAPPVPPLAMAPTAAVAPQPPRVMHVPEWLSSALNKDLQGWNDLLTVADADMPSHPRLGLLLGDSSEIESRPLKREDVPDLIGGVGDGGIRVKRTPTAGQAKGALALRIKDTKLQGVFLEQYDQSLVQRLQFGVLEIKKGTIDSDDAAAVAAEAGRARRGQENNSSALVRVVLTPELPPIPLSGAAWLRKKEALEFLDFLATVSADHPRAAPVLIVERVSLSFLPADNVGWRPECPPCAIAAGVPVEFRLELGAPEDKRRPARVTMKFERGRGIIAKLIDEPTEAGAGDNPEENGPDRKSGEGRANRGAQQQNERALLQDVLRKFGGAHARITFEARGGTADDKIEVLRFGADPSQSHRETKTNSAMP